MLYAAAVLLCLTVLPFLIGFLNGLGGKVRKQEARESAEHSEARGSFWDSDDEFDYWNPLDARINGRKHGR